MESCLSISFFVFFSSICFIVQPLAANHHTHGKFYFTPSIQRISDGLPGVDVQAVSTPGGQDGAVDFQISGGTSPYQIRLSGQPDRTGVSDPIQSYTNLPAGPYTLEVEDNLGTLATLDFLIGQPVTGTVTVQPTCFGERQGRINLRIEGGVGGSFLLDEYPGAEHAYGLRRLRSAYSGPAIKVRRSTDDAIDYVFFTPSGDLDTTALQLFANGAEVLVEKWYDQAGTWDGSDATDGDDAIQTEPTRQPVIYQASSGIVKSNGRPSLLFDGSRTLQVGGLQVGSDYSFFAQLEAEESFASFLRWDASGQLALDSDNGYLVSAGNQQSKLTTNENGLVPGNGSQLASFLLDFGAIGGIQTFVNGQRTSQQTWTDSTASAYGGSPGYIGSDGGTSDFFSGNITELVLYDSALEEQRAAIDSAILSYHQAGVPGGYSLQWSGPAGFSSTATLLDSLAPGLYEVTITDAMGNQDMLNGIQVMELSELGISGLVVTEPSAIDTADGIVTFAIDGGTPPFSVSLGDTAFTTSSRAVNLTGLGAGDYLLSIRTSGPACTFHQRLSITVSGQAPFTQIEYFINNDPGIGEPGTFRVPYSNPLQINLSSPGLQLEEGGYQLGFRIQNQAGVWSHTPFYQYFLVLPAASDLISLPDPSPIVSGELFFTDNGTDPGIEGLGTISFPIPSDTLIQETIFQTLSNLGLSGGQYQLGVRLQSEEGRWSHIAVLNIFVISDQKAIINLPDSSPIVGGEIFIDTDPGISQPGTYAFDLSAPDTVVTDELLAQAISELGLGPGQYRLFIRLRSSNQQWSFAKPLPIVVLPSGGTPTPPDPGRIIGGEIFFNTDPGVDIMDESPRKFFFETPATEIDKEEIRKDLLPFFLDAPNVDHVVGVRLVDEAGHWSFVDTLNITVTDEATSNIQIFSPVGGASFFTEENLSVQWASSPDLVDSLALALFYQIDNGPLQLITDTLFNIDGQFDWRIPDAFVDDSVRFILQSVIDPGAISDQSDFVYIQQSNLQATINSFTNFVFDTLQFSWINNGLPDTSTLVIQRSTDGGLNFSDWQTGIPITDGAFFYPIPPGEEGTYSFRIFPTGRPDKVQFFGGVVFSLPSITLSTLDAEYYPGEIITINFTSPGIDPSDSLRFLLLNDLDQVLDTLAQRVVHSSPFSYHIPFDFAALESNLRIRAEWVAQPTIAVASSVFVVQTPEYTFQEPSGPNPALYKGFANPITWFSQGFDPGVDGTSVSYRSTSTSLWTSIVEGQNVANRDTTIFWVPPTDLEAGDYWLKLTHLSGVEDSLLVTLFEPSISISSPIPGEQFFVDNIAVTWSSSGLPPGAQIRIEYTNDLVNFDTIAENEPNDGFFLWQDFALGPGAVNRVRVVWEANDTVQDQSALFELLPSELTLTSPIASAAYNPGDVVPITWNAEGIGPTVRLAYSTDGGMSYLPIDLNAPNDGSENWIIPGTIPLETLVNIRVTWVSPGNPPLTYSDDRDIVIGDPGFSWVEEPPNQVFEGKNYLLAWDYEGMDDTELVDVQIQSTAGGAWQSIVNDPNFEVQNGAFNWALNYGDFPPGSYQLRLVLLSNTTIQEKTSVFSISTPALNLQLPNVDATYFLGNPLPISWAQSGLTTEPVIVEYGINEAEWTPIDTVPGGNGGYVWNIPQGLIPGVSYKIRLRFEDGAFSLSDRSNEFFQIEQPAISIVQPNTDSEWGVGQLRTIIWNSNGGVAESRRFALEWSPDLSTWYTIADTTNTGSLAWLIDPQITTITGPIPEDGIPFYIRIRSTEAEWSYLGDTSSVFTLLPFATGDNELFPIRIDSLPFFDSRNTIQFAPAYTGPNSNGRADVFYQFGVPDCVDSVFIEVSPTSPGCLHVLDTLGQLVASTCVENNQGQCPGISCLGVSDLNEGDSLLLVVQGGNNSTAYTLSITPIEQEVNLGTDQFICPGDPISLVGNIDNADTYVWGIVGQSDTISNLPTLHLTSADPFYTDALSNGIYLAVTNNNCTRSDTVLINEIDGSLIPFSLTTPPDLVIDQNLPLTLQWQQAGGFMTTLYDVFIWPSGQIRPADPVVEGLSNIQYTIPGQALTFNESYSWQVRARNGCEERFSAEVFTFTLRNLPDLVVSVNQVPNSSGAGATIPVQWTVTNQSTQPTNGSWQDRLFLSTDSVFDPSDQLLTVYPNSSSLSNGSSYTVERSVPLPGSLASGRYYILVRSVGQEELDLTNNIGVSDSLQLSGTPLSDLTVVDLSYSLPADSILFQGDEINIAYTLRNVGSAEATALFSDGVYLLTNTDSILLNSEQRFFLRTNSQGQDERFFSLDPGEEVSFTINAQLPFDVTGRASLGVLTNIFRAFPEELRVNNDTLGPSFLITIPPTPDLVPQNFVGLPDTIENGTGLSLEWITENVGEVAPTADRWVDRIYLSTDPTLDTSSALLVGLGYYTPSQFDSLQPGESVAKTGDLFIPNVITGQYFIYVVENSDQLVNESDFSNNILRSSGLLTIEPNSGGNGLPNDPFIGAIDLSPPENGLGLTAVGFNVDMTTATLEPGEDFADGIHENHDRTVWYRFTIPTSRWVEIFLPAASNNLQGGTDVGLTVFREPGNGRFPRASFPGGTDLADITPLTVFGSAGNFCLESGTYYVRISVDGSTYNEGFPIRGFIDYRTASENTGSVYDYDQFSEAYSFGAIGTEEKSVSFVSGCLSLESLSEVFPTMDTLYGNPDRLGEALPSDWTQTAWFTFQTPVSYDILELTLSSSTSSLAQQESVGLIFYQGDIRSQSIETLDRIDSIVFNTSLISQESFGQNRNKVFFTCNELPINETITVGVLINKEDVHGYKLGLRSQGFQASTGTSPQAPNDLGVLTASDFTGRLSSNSGQFFDLPGEKYQTQNIFACNASLADNPCAESLNFLPGDDIDNDFLKQDGEVYDLSLWYTFTIAEDNVNVGIANILGEPRLAALRLFSGDVSQYCSGSSSLELLETANRGSSNAPNRISNYAFFEQCISAGTYSIQLLGNRNPNSRFGGHLGERTELQINVQKVRPDHRFDLSDVTRIDALNNGQPIFPALNPGVAGGPGNYPFTPDTLGCNLTPLPAEICEELRGRDDLRAIYREFEVGREGVLSINVVGNFTTQLFTGRIQSVPTNDTLTVAEGLGAPLGANCVTSFGRFGYCVSPGVYTLVFYGTEEEIGQISSGSLIFQDYGRHDYADPANPGQLDTLSASSFRTDNDFLVQGPIDTLTCESGILPIQGEGACLPGQNKQFFYEFFLSEPLAVTIEGNLFSSIRIYQGQVSQTGLDGLQPLSAEFSYDNNAGCINGIWRGNICNPLPVGWYTVVLYGQEAAYPPTSTGQSFIAGAKLGSLFNIEIGIAGDTRGMTDYNRPGQAAEMGVTDYALGSGSTTAYPRYDQRYPLPVDTLTCQLDTAALKGQIGFPDGYGRVLFYTFSLTQESFMEIPFPNLQGNQGGGVVGRVQAQLFSGDGKNNPAILNPDDPQYISPINTCSSCLQEERFKISYCNLQPGTYTLVVFFPEAEELANYVFSTEMLVDNSSIGSRFDHLYNAYDFGLIPADNSRYYGAFGDVHPTDPNRAPSNDFFTCETGAIPEEPFVGCSADGPCQGIDCYNPNRYLIDDVSGPPDNKAYDFEYRIPEGTPIYDREKELRTLWHTFQLEGGGEAQVSLYHRTPGLPGFQPGDRSQDDNNICRRDFTSFSVYEFVPTSEDIANHPNIADYTFQELLDFGLISFSHLQRPEDYQRLVLVRNNACSSTLSCLNTNQVNFFRDVCDPSQIVKKRYFVLAGKANTIRTNYQIEVGVKFEPAINAIPDNDLSANAFIISSDNTNPETLTSGTYEGSSSFLGCAERNEPFESDISCGNKTIWWTFESGTSGKIQLSYILDDLEERFQPGEMVLYREVNFGGITERVQIPINQIGDNLGEACLATGRYYLAVTGCFFTLDYITPRIAIIPESGDLCGNPVTIIANQANRTYSASVSIDCHTFGDDFGELGLTNTGCFFDGSGNAFSDELFAELQLKSSWFRIDVDDLGGTVDLAFELDATGVNDPGQVKFRLIYGQCGVFQTAGECQNSIDQFFQLDCLPDETTYYIQAVSPATVNGTVTLSVTVTSSGDANCIPQNPQPIIAEIDVPNQCLGEPITFRNRSSAGQAIAYLWEFGDGNTSSLFEPTYTYTSPPAGPVVLTVTNLISGNSAQDSIFLDLSPVSMGSITLSYSGYTGGNLIPPGIPVTFNPNVSNRQASPPTQFAWDFGDDRFLPISFSEMPIITFSDEEAGARRISVDIANNNCVTTTNQDIVILGSQTNNLGLCPGDTLTLSGDPAALTYEWSTGNLSSSIMVTQADTFVLEQTYSSGAVITDTFLVTDNPVPILDLGPDQFICDGEAAVVFPIKQQNIQEFLWQPGNLAQESVTISTPGLYTLTGISAEGCVVQDDILLSVADNISVDLGPDLTLCPGDSLILQSGFPNSFTHSWSTGDTLNEVTITSSGTFNVFVESEISGCTGFDELQVDVDPDLNVDLGTDVPFCSDSILISADPIANASYLWSTGDSTRSIWVNSSGTYSLTVSTPAGCVVTTSLDVLDVDSCNDFPVAANDTAVLNGASNILVPVTQNDVFGLDGPAGSSIRLIEFPATGNAVVNENGTSGNPSDDQVLFTPEAEFFFQDSFTYEICDGTLDCDTATVFILSSEDPVLLDVQVLLEGALLGRSENETLMRDGLRKDRLIPSEEPYGALPDFVTVKDGGAKLVNSERIQNDLGEQSVVDWVFIEIRSPIKPDSVVATRSGLLQRNGQVVDINDGPLVFEGLMPGNYLVCVRHRNHLGAMVKNPIPLTPSVNFIDFTDTSLDFWENSPQYDGYEQAVVDGQYALWLGNTDLNQRVVFTGQNNDVDDIFNTINTAPGNSFGLLNYSERGYRLADVNLTGKSIYAGQNNNSDLIFNSINRISINFLGLLNFQIQEQLPENE
mgnify:CR=1 FL=1